ncbi:AraC-type DNA-binding protein [Palleronia marisminoris]|uniref:HTH-type transcriptional regulator YesS n=1 Tax=Palleronia marisminoris TaxID=315423 RepID=A0A1Y5TVU9_9RHOB|nr:AraC family transcriptional regulator [Palleronia marisminoris]SFH55458.1 AraC-type DNA-binding protein [Palleronia marisminoris]SLN71452.1 HTH-type transcriptional regulator YesS [Palleronia marisminoris]
MPKGLTSYNCTTSRRLGLESQLDIPFMTVGRIDGKMRTQMHRVVEGGESGVLVLVELGQTSGQGPHVSPTGANSEVYPKASVSIRDLRYPCEVGITEESDTIIFWIGRDALNEFSILSGGPEFTVLSCVEGVNDPSLQGLALALLPALEYPCKSSLLFLKPLALAILAHLTQHYGGLTVAPSRKGGLSARQEAKATEFLTVHLQEDFTLQNLADACGLSRSYFSKAFKVTFGKTPRRWLAEFRVARACELLRTNMPISQISLSCGFADQSHLTRVFSDVMGEPPGGWRRNLRVFSHERPASAEMPLSVKDWGSNRAPLKDLRFLKTHVSLATSPSYPTMAHSKSLPSATAS